MIRSIVSHDWHSIERIQAESYPRDVLETLESLQSHWRVSPSTCLVAEVDGDVIGYILAHAWRKRSIPPLNKIYSELPDGSDSLFVHDLALSPSARGTGVGHDLVQSVLQAGSQLRLTSAALISVQGTEAFWKRFGFVVCDSPSDEYVSSVKRFYPMDEFRYMELDWLVNRP